MVHNKELIYGKPNFEQGGIIIATNNKDIHNQKDVDIHTQILT